MSPDAKVNSLADAFRQRILGGEYGTSGRLPSLRLLSEEYGTTHETMNKVVQLLQAEGLLVSQGRAGVFVNKTRTRIPGITARFDLYLQEHGLVPEETNVDEPAVVAAPIDVAEVFGIDEGAPVVHRMHRQGTRMTPYQLTENFYAVDLAGGPILERMRQDARFDVLLAIKEAHGKVIKRVHEDVIARLPTSREQELLKIVRHAPVLEVQRTNYAEDDKMVVVFNRIIFVASYFVLSYDYVTSLWTGKE
ncbi:MAG TPA: GntR family transcriptional regulator [Ktedonobacteraceae bacterium]|nr:GntR family transcriptional regulator [Ktedonobacteraceae bacterium]